MSDESGGGTPRSFTVISVVALLWNLLGVMSFYMQVVSGAMLASLPAEQRALYDAVPSWVDGVFAIAVFGGVVACIGLLLKKAWCVHVFLVSLAAIIVQFGHWLFATDSIAVVGNEVFLMPALVTAAAVFLLWYSRAAKAKGWLEAG